MNIALFVKFWAMDKMAAIEWARATMVEVTTVGVGFICGTPKRFSVSMNRESGRFVIASQLEVDKTPMFDHCVYQPCCYSTTFMTSSLAGSRAFLV